MVKVVAHPGETADSLIRKFSKKVLSEGILADLKKREFYQKPSERRKEEKEAKERKKGRWPRF